MIYLSDRKWSAIKTELEKFLRREFSSDEMSIANFGDSLVMAMEECSFALDGARMVLSVRKDEGADVVGKMCLLEMVSALTAQAFARLMADTITLIVASVEAKEAE